MTQNWGNFLVGRGHGTWTINNEHGDLEEALVGIGVNNLWGLTSVWLRGKNVTKGWDREQKKPRLRNRKARDKWGRSGGRLGNGDWEWVAHRVSDWERMKERAENEYSKHCFNLKQRRFQENEFQWIWAKNNYRDFLVLFCEWRASLFSGYLRGRKDQSQEIEVMPLCPFTFHTAQ